MSENTPAVGPVYESPEELAAEVVRLREESARAYSQGVEDMREAAMKATSDAPGTPYTPTEAIRDVVLSTRSCECNVIDIEGPSVECPMHGERQPAPRDTDLIQQVRALVKRYGAPVIAAEAARQAKHH